MSGYGVTSIIIPTYNGLHLLSSCVKAIRMYTDVPYEIIVVDNGSDDDTAKYCVQEGLTLVALSSNMGFPTACNKGLAIASGDQLLLLNNDVIVSPKWLSNMLKALHSSESIGIVGPVTNYASGRQQVEVPWNAYDEDLRALEEFNISDHNKWQIVQRLVGMCLLFKRDVFRCVGMMDERFSPGHYEDDDYCYRARSAGYFLLMCGDTFVYHEGSASFKEKHPEGWDSLITRNRSLFIEKWGVDPWNFMS